MTSTSSALISSTSTSCFNLLSSLIIKNKNDIYHSSSESPKISLSALLMILEQRDTPFHSFMTNQCGVNVTSLCHQFIPPQENVTSYNNNQTALQIGEKELEVIFRIFVSAAVAATNNNNNNLSGATGATVEQLCDLLHVTISMAVADAALELIRETKKIIHSTVSSTSAAAVGPTTFHLSNSRHHADDAQQDQYYYSPNRSLFATDKLTNNNLVNYNSTSGSSFDNNNNFTPTKNTSFANQNTSSASTAFDVDFEFVRKVNRHIQTFGSSVTCQKILKVLEKEKKMGKESINLWNYALDTREGLGGMDETTRQDLIGAALEVTGRELYPAVASTHVAAELVFRKIVDCIH